ncbi:tetratricopeptide repeat protein [Rossellomorea marisflavi]|uniref:tetratricopeptide repeat protein n=1 Tax=Rossellomorea TaxID=2837508 RepID=UPI003221C286
MTNQDEFGKVIAFPGLKDRLFEKGVEALEEGDAHAACDLLSQAYELESLNPEISTALVLALYECKEYEEAQGICREMLLEGVGDYFETVDMYLMILIQLHEHQDVVDTLHALFDEKEVPFEKEEHFRKLLQFSEKMLNAPEDEAGEEAHGPPLLEGKSLEEQIIITAGLVQRNIRPYKQELENSLQDEDMHPFVHTMIVNVLREHGVASEILMKKLGREGVVQPENLPEVFTSDAFREAVLALEELLLQDSPSLIRHAEEVLKRHAFLLYPFDMEWEPDDIALAYGHYAAGILGDEDLEKDLQDKMDEGESKTILAFIHELEEISSPNI